MRLNYFFLFLLVACTGLFFSFHSTTVDESKVIKTAISVEITSDAPSFTYDKITWEEAMFNTDNGRITYRGKIGDKRSKAVYFVGPKGALHVEASVEGSPDKTKLSLKRTEDKQILHRLSYNGKLLAQGKVQANAADKKIHLKVTNQTYLASDQFLVLQYLPHEITSVTPGEIFGGSDDEPQAEAAFGIFKKIGKWLGGIKLGGNCSKKTVIRHVCSQVCTQTPGMDPGECAGSMCGSICCCGSCTTEETVERECGGDVSVGT